jgi:hypothetical protein
MRLLSLFLMLIFLSACQEQGPNKLEQYQQAKIKDTQKLEEKFNTAIAKVAEEERQQMVAHTPEGKEVLKNAIEAYAEQNTTSLTPSVDESLLGAIDTAIRQRDELGIVKNGAILMKVRDYEETYEMIQKLTTELEANIIAETQTTTDYNQENTLQLQVNPTEFNKVMDLLGSTATIIRKKQVWQPMAKEEYTPIVSSLEAQAIRQKALVRQFKPTLAVSDKMLLQENLASTNQVINNQLNQAVRLAKDLPKSQITVSIFQPIDFVKPAPEPFNASFSANLELGWENFKVFLLQAATVWPYVLIGTIFLLTVLLATASSKRRARKFRLQTLQAQQQQIAATVAKSTNK